MNCYKCKYEFCWVCLGSYKSYRHAKGMDAFHNLSEAVYALIYATLSLMLMLKMLTYYYGNDVLLGLGSGDLTDDFNASESLFTLRNIFILIAAFVFINAVMIFTVASSAIIYDNRRHVPRVLCLSPFIVVPVLLQLTSMT